MKKICFIHDYEVGMIVENVKDKTRYVVIETFPNVDDDYYSVVNLITEEDYLKMRGRSYSSSDFYISLQIESYNQSDFEYTGKSVIIEIETVFKLR